MEYDIEIENEWALDDVVYSDRANLWKFDKTGTCLRIKDS